MKIILDIERTVWKTIGKLNNAFRGDQILPNRIQYYSRVGFVFTRNLVQLGGYGVNFGYKDPFVELVV